MMKTHLEVRLRLHEIARRSAALSSIRSELADLASQLDRLRSLHGKTRLFAERGDPSDLGKGDNIILYRRLKNN